MKSKRHSPEQIIAILREAEGKKTITQLCQGHNISEQTFYRWRHKYGTLTVAEARRLKALEEENQRLKKLVANKELEIDLLKEVCSKKW